METISENVQNNIDLDIINVLKRVPKNENYSTLYLRMSIPDETIFIDFFGNKEDARQILLEMFNFYQEKDRDYAYEVNNTILDLAIDILAISSDDSIAKFNDAVKERINEIKQ